MKRLKIYLSGGMHSNWRDEVKGYLPQHTFLCPNKTIKTREEWWELDWRLMNQADCMLAYIEKGNWTPVGLLLEVGYCRALGIPITLVNERHCSGVKIKGETTEEREIRYLKNVESWADVVYRELVDAIKQLAIK